jgi:hypothetical protein
MKVITGNLSKHSYVYDECFCNSLILLWDFMFHLHRYANELIALVFLVI